MLFRMFLFCVSAGLFSAPLAAEENGVIAATEIDFPVEYEGEDLEDDDLSFEELVAMEDEMFEDMFFTDEDEDDFEAIIAAEGLDFEEDFVQELPVGIS